MDISLEFDTTGSCQYRPIGAGIGSNGTRIVTEQDGVQMTQDVKKGKRSQNRTAIGRHPKKWSLVSQYLTEEELGTV